MRIDPKGTVAGYPALLVRRTLRRLRTRLQGGLDELESAASLEVGKGRALLKALAAEGLIEAAGDGWQVTQAGQTFSAATAARRVTRATAEKSLQRFLNRVERVNNDAYFLAGCGKMAVFAKIPQPDFDRRKGIDSQHRKCL